MKKKMYYNMRIKTLKRNTTNILRKGKVSLARSPRMQVDGSGLMLSTDAVAVQQNVPGDPCTKM